MELNPLEYFVSCIIWRFILTLHKPKRMSKNNTKYIFVTGGVTSSLGKGIVSASLGMLLKARGFKVTIQKLDPYINIDPGTLTRTNTANAMSPKMAQKQT